MATNEFEEPPVPTRSEQLASIFGKTKAAVTGSTTMPMRVVVLLVTAAFLASWGQWWWWSGPVIVACIILLALSWPGSKH